MLCSTRFTSVRIEWLRSRGVSKSKNIPDMRSNSIVLVIALIALLGVIPAAYGCGGDAELSDDLEQEPKSTGIDLLHVEYDVSPICEVQITNHQSGTFDGIQRALTKQEHKYVFRDQLRVPIYERVITLYQDEAEAVDLVCQIDMNKQVLAAWQEQPVRWRRKASARVKRQEMSVIDGAIPPINDLSLVREERWFSMCGGSGLYAPEPDFPGPEVTVPEIEEIEADYERTIVL